VTTAITAAVVRGVRALHDRAHRSKAMPVVRVSWFEGKNHEQKKKVAAEITDSIVRNTATDPKYIYVIFEDVSPSDWSGSGELFGKPGE
jgi:4-oxalocrotonate tautomerase